jgi:hypothetical protein
MRAGKKVEKCDCNYIYTGNTYLSVGAWSRTLRGQYLVS